MLIGVSAMVIMLVAEINFRTQITSEIYFNIQTRGRYMFNDQIRDLLVPSKDEKWP